MSRPVFMTRFVACSRGCGAGERGGRNETLRHADNLLSGRRRPMSRQCRTVVLGAIVCVATTLTAGCDGRVRPAPISPAPIPGTPAPPPTSNAPRVWAISPNTGSIDGRTPVLITGEGFEPGATVTLDGAATNVTLTGSTSITAITAPHAAAAVDVVVINPGGQSGRLIGGYTYAVVAAGPAPSITAVSPDVGTTGGGADIRITGANFQPGATVNLDGQQLRTFPFGATTTTLHARVPSHAPATVDLVVINPDGQRATLTAGFRYAAPGTLDFSGRWTGVADHLRDDHASTEVAFTIENNKVVSVACNSTATTLSPAAVVNDDEFSFPAEDRILVSGRFVSPTTARGSIEIAPCGRTWGAEKQR